jgi:hypothetical protein
MGVGVIVFEKSRGFLDLAQLHFWKMKCTVRQIRSLADESGEWLRRKSQQIFQRERRSPQR